MKPYVIVAPEYDYTSGGIKVMWGLFGWLLAKGFVTYMNRYPQGDVVAVYPEITHGNPVGAKSVVRYILNKPGVMRSFGVPGPTEFDPSDKIFVFSRLFDVFDSNEDHFMFLPVIDLHTFTDQHKNRNKTAFFVGKGVDLGLHPKDAIKINREVVNDQQSLANLLNECSVLYDYDPVSAITEVSRLCGCRVNLLQNVYSKDEYRNYEPGLNGISFGLDEEVPLDSEGFVGHYRSLRQVFSRKLDRFIEITQS